MYDLGTLANLTPGQGDLVKGKGVAGGTRRQFPFWLGIGLCVCLVWGAYVFKSGFSHYMAARGKAWALRQQVQQIRQIQRQWSAHRDIVAKAVAFVQKARALGLTEDEWKRYEVEIHRKVSFSRLGQILDQTVSGPRYFFEPLKLTISRVSAEKGLTKVSSSQAVGPTQGDVLLELKGGFVVRSQ